MTTIYTDRAGGGSGGWAGHPEQSSHGRMSHTLVSDSSAQPRNGVSPAVGQSHSHSWVPHGLQGPGAHPSYRHSFGEAEPNPKHREGNTPAKTSEVQLPPWVCSTAGGGSGHSQGPLMTKMTRCRAHLALQAAASTRRKSLTVSQCVPPALPPARTNHPWMCWGGNLSCVLYPHTELSWGFHRVTESLRKGL